VSDSNIKITDKRMFTSDGRLREEYRFLEDKLAEKPGSPAEATPETRPETGPEARPEPPPQTRSEARPPGPPPAPEPDEEEEVDGGPGFLDLIASMAEPTSLYLGDIPLPDGRSGQDLQMARLYIDLLDVLRRKTAGNLTARESAVLEDVIYQLRMRYVQKTGR